MCVTFNERASVATGSAADTAGVREGDVLVTVNNISVIESTLEEVIHLIGKGGCSLYSNIHSKTQVFTVTFTVKHRCSQ